MKKLDLSNVNNLKEDKRFVNFPDYLKDPTNFENTQKRLREVLKTDHTHKSPKQYVECVSCQERLKERKQLMKDIGFVSFDQYLQWQKIMEIMISQKDFKIS